MANEGYRGKPTERATSGPTHRQGVVCTPEGVRYVVTAHDAADAGDGFEAELERIKEGLLTNRVCALRPGWTIARA